MDDATRPTLVTDEVVERVIRKLRAHSIPQAKAEYGIGWNCGLEEAEDVVRKTLAAMPTIDQDGGEAAKVKCALALFNSLSERGNRYAAVKVDGPLTWTITEPRTDEALLAALETK